jgi:hypothetical protein
MSASVSQRSAPTISSTRISPPIETFDYRRDPSVMDAWTTGHDDPITAYTIRNRQPVRSLSQRNSDLEKVTEIESGERPDEFFARTCTNPIFSVTPSPIDIPTGGQWRSSNHRETTSSRRRPSFGIATPTTPSTAALTTGTTFASDMSRQSSFCNDALVGPFEMMNVHSNTSIFTDGNATDERSYSIPFPPSSTYSKFSSSEEQSQLLVGAGGVGDESQFPQSFHDFGAPGTQFQSLPSFMEDMKRSPSNESSTSSMSATSRSATQLKRLLLASSRPLAPAPTPAGDEVAMSREGSHAMVSTKSKDGSDNRNVAAITKAPYQRPKHDRVMCTLCNDVPEGFRGQHELGRHNDRQHKEQVKKWVCIEPADGVINPLFRPVNPLSKCKACSAQKKKYGAYYNAAAHLRRAHFRPKQRGHKKSTKGGDKTENRGGKAGGDWPPMLELKRWMKEVYENAADSQQPDVNEEDEEEDVEDDDCSGSYKVDNYTKLQDMSNISGINADFDNAYLYNDTTMLDAYPATPSHFNTQSTQNMPYGTLATTQDIDLSMRIDSGQSSFADSHFAAMNAQMTFIDHFPQTFADQLIGQDSFSNFQY